MLKIIFLLFFSLSSFAGEKYFVYMGAGGDPTGPTTIFDDDISALGNFAKSTPSWKFHISLNGGHDKTEGIIKKSFGKVGVTNIPFTKKSYNDLLDDYEKKLTNGSIKEGDQLLLLLSSHGSISKGKTHELATSGKPIEDVETLSGAETVSLDRLEKVVKLAKEKKVKLAIIDNSCFSGNTLKLADDNVCVITAAGPKHVSYMSKGTFSSQFASLLKTGESLEDTFLKARSDSQDRGFPMISTPQGKEIQDELYPKLADYMQGTIEDLLPALTNEIKKDSCEFDDNFWALSKYLKKNYSNMDTANIYFGGKSTALPVNSIAQALDIAFLQYNFHVGDVKAKLLSLGDSSFKNTKEVCVEADSCSDLSLYEIATFDENALEASVKELEALKKTVSKADAEELSEMIKLTVKLQKIIPVLKKEILASTPALKNAMNVQEEIQKANGQLEQLSFDVSLKSKFLYMALYQAKMKKDKSSNPCRDFVL